MKPWKVAAVCCALCASLAGASLLVPRHAEPVRGREAHSEASAAHAKHELSSTTGVLGQAALPHAWKVGTEKRYTMQLNFDMAPDSDAPDAPRVRLSGTLRRTVLERAGDLTDVEFQLESPEFVAPVPQTGKMGRVYALEQELKRPFYASYDARGHLRKVHFSPEASAAAQPLLRGVLAHTQFVAAEDGAAEWTSEELDATGEYLARYRRLEGGRHEKRKVRYLRVPGPRGLSKEGASAYAIEHSQGTLTTGSDGQLEGMSVRELVGLKSSDSDEAHFKVEARMSLTLLSSAVVGASTLARRAGPLVVAEVAPLTSMEVGSSADVDRQMLGGADFATLTSELTELPAEAHKERAGVQARLSALFRLEPDAMAEASARIGKGDAHADVLIGALGGADTPAAERALLDLALDDKLSPAARQTTLSALTIFSHPTAESQRELTRLVDDQDPDVRAAAGLALGASIHHGKPEATAPAAQKLAQQVASADSKAELENALNSLGNAGHPDTLVTLKQALQSTDANVRSAAARALRFIPGAEVDALLGQLMGRDPSDMVRSSAVFAARFRTAETMLDPVVALCSREPEASVRRMAIDTLGKWTRVSDEPIQALDWLAEHDPDADNRKAAAETLLHATAT